MSTTPDDDFAALLRGAQEGDLAARDRIITLLYQDFRRIAVGRMRKERTDHTLQPTALVNEALRKLLSDGTFSSATGRTFLYSAAAKAMEQVLIDHHRHHNARKGPGALSRIPLDDVFHHLATVEDLPVADLNEALAALGRTDERASLVVRLIFFLGMTQPEVAESLGISQKTVERDWRFARAWLHERLKPPEIS